MSEETVVRQCAPTLAGIKTGSLFPCPYDSREELLQDVRSLNKRLVPKGLCLLPMRYQGNRALLYLYRPRCLRRDLTNDLATEVLSGAGYQGKSCEQCVARLMHRLREGQEFPHEVGLFLSYPPEDVKGFIDKGQLAPDALVIDNRAENFKCAGLWKVYGDEKRARELFARYKRCTDIYCALWRAGSSIEQLAVPV